VGAVKPRAVVAMAHVASVAASIAFYEKLGFEVGNTFTPQGAAEPSWAWLECGAAAQLMVTKGSHAARHSVLFYLYVDDVAAAHAELAAAGVGAGEIRTEFYAERGEFRVTDPDGYTLMITHT